MTPRGVVLHTVGVQGESSLESIRAYHRSLGWRDVGYHWYVRRDGTVLAGRAEATAGAHTAGANDTVGVCFEGDGDRQPWTYAQWQAGLRLVVEVCQRYGFGADDVCGHREAPRVFRATATSKSCPGRLVDLDEVRHEVAFALAEARRG